MDDSLPLPVRASRWELSHKVCEFGFPELPFFFEQGTVYLHPDGRWILETAEVYFEGVAIFHRRQQQDIGADLAKRLLEAEGYGFPVRDRQQQPTTDSTALTEASGQKRKRDLHEQWARLHQGGLSHQQIANRHKDQTGQEISSDAVRKALKRLPTDEGCGQ